MDMPLVNIKCPSAVKQSITHIARLPLKGRFQVPVNILQMIAVDANTVSSKTNGFIVADLICKNVFLFEIKKVLCRVTLQVYKSQNT